MVNIGPVAGLVREGTVRRYNAQKGTITVALNLAKSESLPNTEFEVPLPASWAGSDGSEFSGGCPVIGSTIWIGMAPGGRWAPLSYVPATGVFGAVSNTTLKPGRWVTQVKNNIRIIADPKIGIQAGDPESYIHLDPAKSILSYDFDQTLSFTEASRQIVGTVKRDVISNSNRNITGSALTSHIYDESLREVGLDPHTKTGTAFNRNPSFTESREIIYEFANSFGFTNDEQELAIYDGEQQSALSDNFNRRDSRADTLSLSLISPNQLMETIRGTVVDIYGNLLDINRAILPSGSTNELSFRSTESNKSDVFIGLREQNRKTIAYHFELNARKSEAIPDVNDRTDYARNRSRFFIDIDKEGQVKINVPASSETGNIPLLTRYENYSTIYAKEKDTNPNEFIRNVDGQDIFLEEFGVGAIDLTGSNDTLEGFAAPVDNNTREPIKLGTAYHNIKDTIKLHQRATPVNAFYPQSRLNNIAPVTEVVSSSITVNGIDANAGGRSLTANFDGQISLSVGANTVDRQSLWLDTAGGLVFNIGRDRFNRSLAGSFDGDVLLQIGGATIDNDSRFSEGNAVRNGALDIRVVANGQMVVLRMDASGIVVESPGRLDFVAEQDIRFKSKRGDVYIDGESIYLYANERSTGRLVTRKPGQTI